MSSSNVTMIAPTNSPTNQVADLDLPPPKDPSAPPAPPLNDSSAPPPPPKDSSAPPPPNVAEVLKLSRNIVLEPTRQLEVTSPPLPYVAPAVPLLALVVPSQVTGTTGPMSSPLIHLGSSGRSANQMLKGAWTKPLAMSSNLSQETIAWPILSAEKVSRKKHLQAAQGLQTHSTRNHGFTFSENLSHKSSEEIPLSDQSTTDINLKEISSRFPWAAKMNPISRNLHRVTSPVYMDDGTPKVLIPDSVLLQGLENQKEYVIGQFYRCSVPSGGLIHAVLNRIWGKKCRIFVRKLGEFSYIFHIPDVATRTWVLQRGLWHVDDCIMFVAPWSSSASLSLPAIKTIPVWVTLKSIPSQLYSIIGIKWIASGLGEPVQTYKPWLDPTLLGEAKILVELELEKPFPQRIAAEDKEGNISMIAVEYSWLPSKCERCGQLGHKEKRCLLPLGQRSKDSMPATSATCVALASDTCPIGVVFNQASIAGTTKETIPTSAMAATLVSALQHSTKYSEIAISPNVITTSKDFSHTTSLSKDVPNNQEISVGISPIALAPVSAHEVSIPTTPLYANKESESVDPNVIANADDLTSLATISVLENMAFHPAPTIICINETIVSPMSESTQIDTLSDTHIAQAKPTEKSSRIAEFDFGFNKFASLISLEEEEDSLDSDNEMDSMDLMTPSGKRILRERPVKPSIKFRDMHLQSTVRGRGTRGRGNRGGRG